MCSQKSTFKRLQEGSTKQSRQPIVQDQAHALWQATLASLVCGLAVAWTCGSACQRVKSGSEEANPSLPVQDEVLRVPPGSLLSPDPPQLKLTA